MEGDDDELRTQTVFHDCWKTYKVFHVVSPYFAHANPPRRLFEGGVYFTQLCGICSRAASIRTGNTVV